MDRLKERARTCVTAWPRGVTKESTLAAVEQALLQTHQEGRRAAFREAAEFVDGLVMGSLPGRIQEMIVKRLRAMANEAGKEDQGGRL